MFLLRYLARFLLAAITFFYRLLRDWWFGRWKQMRPVVVMVVGWGTAGAIGLLLLTTAPELGKAVLNLVFASAVLIGVIYYTLNGLHGGGKKKKKKK